MEEGTWTPGKTDPQESGQPRSYRHGEDNLPEAVDAVGGRPCRRCVAGRDRVWPVGVVVKQRRHEPTEGIRVLGAAVSSTAAVEPVLIGGLRTPDLGGTARTADMGRTLAEAV